MTDPPPTTTLRPFNLDRFQIEAIEALDAGQSVLVAAPTGSGKTVVAEHAIERALAAGGRAFYTTPIKALSNQKFYDLVALHGPERIGLLTGDNAVNGDAPVVVMTTEVLRNMIYAASPALEGLQVVVLDEVHYLQDAYRGPVWEEVIVHLPVAVRLVCLSATVSNAAELADWISTVRGPTAAIVEERRPVALENLYAVEDRQRDELLVLPTLVDGEPNPDARRFDLDPRRDWRGRGRRRYATPHRVDLVELLADRALLPTIVFIFSRAACDDAMRACVQTGRRLTGPDERERIRALVEHHVEPLRDDDLEILGYPAWSAGLEAGFAAHHAGMVPPFKEAVEACFAEGLVKVVFATETLALGINMPARSVVIEKLTKYTGERHEFLTPAQYTQLTGRAGRRGIDDEGTAIALWSPFIGFDQVAELVASRSFRLTSSFRPTYNMAANLVRRYTAERAHHLLNLSFAQFQTDRAVVRLEARLDKRRARLSELRTAATCERGDVEEYRRLVEAERAAPNPARAAVDDALVRLKPGDVIWVQGGKSAGKAVVLSIAHRKGAVRLRALTVARRVLNLGASDFRVAPEVLGAVELPEPFAPQTTAFQRAVVQRLRRLDVRPSDTAGPETAAAAASFDHPVAACPDRDAHLRASRQAARVEREVADIKRQVKGESESLARTFDRILQLLEAWGHIDGWQLTPRGEQLARLYHEADLLVAEALETGLLDDLDPASMAGLVSCFTYEHRSAGPAPDPWFPSGKCRHRFEQIDQLSAELNADERQLGLPSTRPPEPGFFPYAHAWAAGETLDEMLADEELSPGDFVRNVKQLLDLLRQIADATTVPATRRVALDAADRLFRGVVEASSTVAIAQPAGPEPRS